VEEGKRIPSELPISSITEKTLKRETDIQGVKLMDKEMKTNLIDLANEMRLAGSAVAELSHRVDKIYGESMGEAVNAEAVTSELKERVERLQDVVDQLRAVEAYLLSNSLNLADLVERASKEDDR
jgi:hypothetical protein